jgi:hypothetical protein
VTGNGRYGSRRVQIAMVHGGSLEWATVNSLIETMAGDSVSRGLFGFTQTQTIYVPAARQEIALRFLNTEAWAEWLMFVDSDISWKLQDAYALFDSAEHYHLGGIGSVMMGTVFLLGPHGIHAAGWHEGETAIDWQEGGVQDVFTVGTGFTLYHRDVLQKVQEAHGTMFAEAWEGQRFYGEDVAFSYRARDVGARMFVNCDIRIGHVKRVMLDEGWARASQAMRAADADERESPVEWHTTDPKSRR